MVRTHRVLALAALLMSLPLIMAMGSGSSDAPTRIPEPKVNYLVSLTDQGGTTVELSHFSIEGVGFVSGGMGRGDLAVPLDQVKSVDIRQLEGDLKATLSMADGKTVNVVVKGGLMATGKTDFGNYRIPLDQVSHIAVKGIAR
ncbi:MAG: hypothetical protein K9K66_02525 [Desulfarculaceae bacterium]|nr:hypothetical protein [Desulfarculaceae bacterium]MCF8070924.1 hypothetical protein [Desulfarculaceae bacterium]MCF8100512.1 hypothetical protein [Desulfarculaceae bacterium]MCF8116538.1 hypothetical protein [Desulfarculaceae bacterium]